MNNKIVKIDLEKESYNIKIGGGLFEDIASQVKTALNISNPSSKNQIFIVTDENIAPIYLSSISQKLSDVGFSVKEIILPAGESTKSIDNYNKLLLGVLSHKPERQSSLLALGGGVIGDLTGFVASTVLRGVNFIQVPTSLLAMVDSSVGGKTGINCEYGKNLIGAFYQPRLVIANLDVIDTLPVREIHAGYAEIAKYGLIGDKAFFEFLEKEINSDEDVKSNLPYLVEKSCRAKADTVSADEKEKGQRALLNLGHTFGHALEAIMKYDGRLLHGEAVAIGMVIAYKLSEYLNICSKGCTDRLEEHFQNLGIRTKISDLGIDVTAPQMIDLMKGDKKVSDGKMVFILAKDIGECYIDKNIDEKILSKFLEKEIQR